MKSNSRSQQPGLKTFVALAIPATLVLCGRPWAALAAAIILIAASLVPASQPALQPITSRRSRRTR